MLKFTLQDPVPPLENAQVFSCVKCWLKSHRFNSLEREHPKAIQVQVELIQGEHKLVCFKQILKGE